MAKKQLTDEQRAKARERARVQNAKPEVKARKAAHQNKPENLAKRAAYYQRPEVKARHKKRNGTDEWKAYCREYRSTEKGMRASKDANLRNNTDGTFTLELWETLVKMQGNACAICRRPFSANPRQVHADHCHDTMTPRGLLCQACNHAEGQIKKIGLSPEEFGRRLSAYLGNPPAARVVAESMQVNPAEEI